MEAELAEAHRRLTESREAERLHLAQELHDGPMQDLYGVRFQLKELVEALYNQVHLARLDEVQATLQHVIQTLRAICGELRPPALAPFGTMHPRHHKGIHIAGNGRMRQVQSDVPGVLEYFPDRVACGSRPRPAATGPR